MKPFQIIIVDILMITFSYSCLEYGITGSDKCNISSKEVEGWEFSNSNLVKKIPLT
jgi:hypothetical protein